jgi:hypothetical protein
VLIVFYQGGDKGNEQASSTWQWPLNSW